MMQQGNPKERIDILSLPFRHLCLRAKYKYVLSTKMTEQGKFLFL